MSRGFERIAVFVGSAALAGGAVAGCGSGSSATATASGQQQQEQAGAPPRPGRNSSALAKELGLTTAKVKAALVAARPNGGPPAGAQASPSATPATATNT
jgi:hypothetical protein